MSKPARTIAIFGAYLAILGTLLIVIPNRLLLIVGLPPTDDVWIRIAGMLTAFLAFYYIQAAHNELIPFFRWTVLIRVSVIFFFAIFVLLGFTRPILLVLGIVDLIGAFWTGLALQLSDNNLKD